MDQVEIEKKMVLYEEQLKKKDMDHRAHIHNLERRMLQDKVIVLLACDKGYQKKLSGKFIRIKLKRRCWSKSMKQLLISDEWPTNKWPK